MVLFASTLALAFLIHYLNSKIKFTLRFVNTHNISWYVKSVITAVSHDLKFSDFIFEPVIHFTDGCDEKILYSHITNSQTSEINTYSVDETTDYSVRFPQMLGKYNIQIEQGR